MITGELRNQVDKLWTEFWTGGITNPLMVIEQISFLMFARLLDIRETREEKKASRTGKDFSRIFPKGKQNEDPEQELYFLVELLLDKVESQRFFQRYFCPLPFFRQELIGL